MDRNLTVERLYYLGDFRNIKFGSNINNISENLLDEFIDQYDLFSALLQNQNFKNRFSCIFIRFCIKRMTYRGIVESRWG